MSSTTAKAPPKGGLVVLSLAATAYALAQTAVIPAMAGMSTALHASTTSVSWVLTGYLVSAAILTPVLGRLGDMFGKRRMLAIALLVFAAGGVMAALSHSIWLVVIARILQGAGGGIFPLCFGIISDDFPSEKRPGALGLISAISGIGAGAGLLLGGVLMDHTSYHWIFWSGALLAGAATLGVRTLPDSSNRAPGKVDYVGALVLAVGITAPLVALTETTQWGWGDARTLSLIGAGVLVLTVFCLYENRTAEPLVDMRVLRRPTVLITNLTTLLAGFAMFAAFVLIPQIAQTPKVAGYGFGMDATGAGLLLLPACLVMLLAGPLSGRLAQRFGARIPLAVGMLISAAGLGLLAVEHGSQGGVVGFSVVVFIGMGLSLAAMPNLIVDAVPHAMTGQATGVNALIRTLGSSVGSQVAATLLASSVTTQHPLPTDGAFATAFALGMGTALFASVASLFIPRTSDQPRTTAEEKAVVRGEPAQTDKAH